MNFTFFTDPVVFEPLMIKFNKYWRTCSFIFKLNLGMIIKFAFIFQWFKIYTFQEWLLFQYICWEWWEIYMLKCHDFLHPFTNKVTKKNPEWYIKVVLLLANAWLIRPSTSEIKIYFIPYKIWNWKWKTQPLKSLHSQSFLSTLWALLPSSLTSIH